MLVCVAVMRLAIAVAAAQKARVTRSSESEVVSILNNCVLGGSGMMESISDGGRTHLVSGFWSNFHDSR